LGNTRLSLHLRVMLVCSTNKFMFSTLCPARAVTKLMISTFGPATHPTKFMFSTLSARAQQRRHPTKFMFSTLCPGRARADERPARRQEGRLRIPPLGPKRQGLWDLIQSNSTRTPPNLICICCFLGLLFCDWFLIESNRDYSGT